jgi:hypothetical protein
LQKLDRAWYDFDGGYDDRNNPFADIPEEYTKKKEEQMAKHAVKRMSAQQRQINKVSSLPSPFPDFVLLFCQYFGHYTAPRLPIFFSCASISIV